MVEKSVRIEVQTSQSDPIGNSLSLSNITDTKVYPSRSFPDLFGMNGEQPVPSTEINPPSPVQLCSSAPLADGKSADAELRDFPDSSSPHRTSNLMNLSAHDLKVAADQ
jgi:hypothetical protein